MNQTIHLQVTSPLLAIDARGSKFVVIPAGSIVNTSDHFPGPGFHPVMYDGQDLLAFTRDLRERTEPCSPMSISGDLSQTRELRRLRPCVASAVD
jgi:hypothetical protein